MLVAAGWHGFESETPPAGWPAVDGALVGDAPDGEWNDLRLWVRGRVFAQPITGTHR